MQDWGNANLLYLTIFLKHFPRKKWNNVVSFILVVQDLDRTAAATYDTSYNVEQYSGELSEWWMMMMNDEEKKVFFFRWNLAQL